MGRDPGIFGRNARPYMIESGAGCSRMEQRARAYWWQAATRPPGSLQARAGALPVAAFTARPQT